MTIAHATPLALDNRTTARAIMRYSTESEGYLVPFTPLALPAEPKDGDSDVEHGMWENEDFSTGTDGSWMPQAADFGLRRVSRLKRLTQIDPADPAEDDTNDFLGFHLV